jgi:hypothetical protein
MKSVPNCISYVHKFSQIFPHFLSIFHGQNTEFGFYCLNWKICRWWARLAATMLSGVVFGLFLWGRRCPNTVRPGIKGVGVLTTSALSRQAERSTAAGSTICTAGAHSPHRVKPPVFASELVAGVGAVAARAHRAPRERRARAPPPPSLR